MILSTNWAKSGKSLAAIEASTIRTLAGKRWRKSSRRKAVSVQLVLVAVACGGVTGLAFCPLAPLRETIVGHDVVQKRLYRSMSGFLSCVYGFVSGGERTRSLTSWAYSGVSDAIISSNIVFSAVIPLVQNWASIRANQI